MILKAKNIFWKLTLSIESITYLVVIPMSIYVIFVLGGFVNEGLLYTFISVSVAIIINIALGIYIRKRIIYADLYSLYESNQLEEKELIEIKKKLLRFPLIEGFTMFFRWLLGVSSALLIINIFISVSSTQCIAMSIFAVILGVVGFMLNYINSEKFIIDIFIEKKLGHIKVEDDNYINLGLSKKIFVGLLSIVLMGAFTYSYLAYDIHYKIIDPEKYVLHLIISTICLVYITSTFSYVFIKSIKKSIGQIEYAISSITENNLNVNFAIVTSDEIGNMGRNLHKMKDNLRELIKHIAYMAENLGTSSEQMAASSQQSNSMADNMSEIIDNFSKSFLEESQFIEQTTQTINEMAVSIQQVAKNIETTNKVGKGAEESSKNGKNAVERAIQKMADVQNVMKQSVEATEILKNNSDEIGNIVEVITNIAEQTNLLALNASIEAARAGESGKGFTVVAEEVRKLAEQSSNAAAQITQLIEEVQKGTNIAVNLMKEGSLAVEEGSYTVVETGNTFDEIHKSIDAIACDIDEVSLSIQQMSTNSEQIVEVMDNITEMSGERISDTQQISSASQEQVSAIEEITSTSENLAQIAGELKKQIGQFKI